MQIAVQDGREAFVFPFRADTYEHHVDGVVVPLCPQELQPAGREQPAAGLLQGLRQARETDGESGDLLVGIEDDAAGIVVQPADVFSTLFCNLLFREGNEVPDFGERGIVFFEEPGDQVLAFLQLTHVGDAQAVAFQQFVCQLVQPPGHRLADGEKILKPICLFLKAQPLEIIFVIRSIEKIVRLRHAVEPVDHQPLLVHRIVAQRPVNLSHPQA